MITIPIFCERIMSSGKVWVLFFSSYMGKTVEKTEIFKKSRRRKLWIQSIFTSIKTDLLLRTSRGGDRLMQRLTSHLFQIRLPLFIIKGFQTTVFILIVISTTFRSYVLWPSPGVGRTREPTRNFELCPLLNSREWPVLIPSAITGYKWGASGGVMVSKLD